MWFSGQQPRGVGGHLRVDGLALVPGYPHQQPCGTDARFVALGGVNEAQRSGHAAVSRAAVTRSAVLHRSSIEARQGFRLSWPDYSSQASGIIGLMSPLFPDGRAPERVALVGDLHGNTVAARRAVERASYGQAQLMVQLGDWGLWPGREGEKFVRDVDRQLGHYGLAMAWLSGNHDDYDQLGAIGIDPVTGLQRITDRIWHLPRGYRWTWNDHTWLALGGAVSVDRKWRREGVDWWPGEVLSEADVQRAIEGGPVDVLLTHDCPTGVEVPGLTPNEWPADAVADSGAHRDVLRRVVDAVRPRRLIHGHYHVRHSADLDLAWAPDRPDWTGVCRVEGLAHDQGPWQDNMMLVGPDGATLPWPGQE